MGAKIYSGDKSGVVTETGAYEGHVNPKRRVKGLEWAPGDLYIMYSQGGKTNLVINTEKEGIASVVTVRELELQDGSKLGTSEVVQYFGLSKDHNRRTFLDAGLRIELNPISSTFIPRDAAHKYGIKSMSDNCLGYYRK